MLSKISRYLKKSVPLALSLLFPISSQASIGRVNVHGHNVLVEICTGIRRIEVDTKSQAIADEAASLSLIEHQRVLLENSIGDLDYGAYSLLKDSVSQSRILSKKLDKISDWMDFNQEKIPTYTFVFYGIKPKFFVLDEARDLRLRASSYLYRYDDLVKSNPSGTYSDLVLLNSLVENLKRFIRETRDFTELDSLFTLAEMNKLEKQFRSDLKTLKGRRLERNLKEIESRIMDRIRDGIKKSDPGIRYFQERANILKAQRASLSRAIGYYKVEPKPPKVFFKSSYEIPLYQTNRMSSDSTSASLDIIIEKTCIDGNNFNLRLSVLPQNWEGQNENEESRRGRFDDNIVFDPLQSGIFLIYENPASLVSHDQSAVTLSAKENIKSWNFSEVIPSKRDELKKDIIVYSFNEAAKRAFPGIKERIMNVFEYLGDKILEFERSRKESTAEFLDAVLQEYSSAEISFLPTTKYSTARLVSARLEDVGKSPMYLVLNLGLKDFARRFVGNLEGLIIQIPNDELEVLVLTEQKWIFPSEWTMSRGAKIGIIGSEQINRRDNIPEYSNISIMGDKYRLVDDEFVKEHKKDWRDARFVPIYLSTGPIHLELTNKRLSKESLLGGVYLIKEEDLRVDSPTPPVGYNRSQGYSGLKGIYLPQINVSGLGADISGIGIDPGPLNRMTGNAISGIVPGSEKWIIKDSSETKKSK